MAFLGLHLSSGAHVASEAVMGVLMHLTKSITYDGRNAMVAVRSIGDPEGGAPGYAVVYCRGDDLAVSYRSVDDVGPVVVVTHPRQRLLATSPRHIVIGPDQVSARIWSAVPVWAAR
jgi:3',5'-cyclic-AMP phosphodiesterase